MRNVLLIGMLISLLGCASQPAGPQPDIEGSWVVSNYQVRGTVTSERDGTVVRIYREGDTFRVSGSIGTATLDDARFRWDGYQFRGAVVPDYGGLRELFKTTPAHVLRDAAASKTGVYRTTLTMMPNGRMAVASDNLGVNYGQDGRFWSFDRHEGWWRFHLTRRP